MRKERYGRLSKTHFLLAERDLEFLSLYDDLFSLVMTKKRALDLRSKEFIAMGILASKGEYDALNTHIHRALEIGISESEILEVLETTMLYSGTEAMLRGCLELIDTLKGKKEKL
jgi:alkylhydroperoxidase/carboxymuconolactone decarboxylase family protein YurZ